ncbi:hypothetical protein FPSE5266_02058 [Fusarium pseudograminearum]|nr:hypothetical protein FPSE5266_02058 [Fusarium pseudograminearum]
MMAVRPEMAGAIRKYSEPVTGELVIHHQVQYLGTDRRLTYSMLSQGKHLQTLFVPDAVSETVAPQSLFHYLSQRRRWGSNAYFNKYFYLSGKKMIPITRIAASIEVIRLSLVYYRILNTALFITSCVRHITALKLVPMLVVGQLPSLWFFCSILLEPVLRKRGHKLLIGYLMNKCVSPFMSVITFTKVATNLGSQVWGVSGVTASSAAPPAAAPGNEEGENKIATDALDAAERGEVVPSMIQDTGGLTKPGRARLRDECVDVEWSITAGINITNGVVVAGAGENKTVLVLQDRPSQPVFTLGTPANNTRPRYGFRSNITNQYLPIGSSSVDVISSDGFAVDQLVYVSRNATEAWIRGNGMNSLVRDDGQQTWLPVDKRMLSPNQISSISGSNITLRIPLTDNFDSNYVQPELLVYTPPYANKEIGIQDLGVEVPDTCSGAPFNDKTCNSAAVYFPSWTVDSWASGLSLKGFNKFFQVDQDASRITIQNCTMDRDQDIQGAALPFDIMIQGSQILVQDCSQNGIPSARCFTVGTGSLTPGPNAVLRHKTKSDVQTIYPHERWAHGLLVEDSSVKTLFVDRGIKGSGHGWSINGGVGWNLDGNVDFESPPLGINWCVGCGGNGHETKGNATFVESGKRVEPRSLFMAQLEERGIHRYDQGDEETDE